MYKRVKRRVEKRETAQSECGVNITKNYFKLIYFFLHTHALVISYFFVGILQFKLIAYCIEIENRENILLTKHMRAAALVAMQ